MTESQVHAATPELAPDVAATLRAAFADDPVINWMLRSDERAPEAWDDFFSSSVDDHLGAGRLVDAVTVDGSVAGAALWTPPPGAQPTPWRGRLGLWSLRRWTGLRRFPRFWRLVAATEARYPPFPHYYLFLLGVSPDAQGRGIGAALLDARLAAVDREGLPAYLESTNPRNLSLYRRHGFEVVEELRLGRGAPPMWLMLREPGATAASTEPARTATRVDG